jgi:hypothetical protein
MAETTAELPELLTSAMLLADMAAMADLNAEVEENTAAMSRAHEDAMALAAEGVEVGDLGFHALAVQAFKGRRDVENQKGQLANFRTEVANKFRGTKVEVAPVDKDSKGIVAYTYTNKFSGHVRDPDMEGRTRDGVRSRIVTGTIADVFTDGSLKVDPDFVSRVLGGRAYRVYPADAEGNRQAYVRFSR